MKRKKKAGVREPVKTAHVSAAALISLLAAAWMLMVGWRYYHGHDWVALWRMWYYWPSLMPDLFAVRAGAIFGYLKLLAELFWLVLLGYGAGASLLGYAGLDSGERPGQFALALAAGWGGMSLCMLLLGSAGAWNEPLLFALLCAGTCALAVKYWRSLRTVRPTFVLPVRGADLFSWNSVWLAALLGFAGLNFITALVPEIFYDSLVYHLALPDLYWRHGGIIATPWNLYSGLPQLIENLYAIALPIGGDGLTRLLHWAFGLLSALLTYVAAGRLVNKNAAGPAALLFYSLPAVGILSGESMTDLGWVFFQFSALYALCIRIEAPEAPRRWTVLAGLLSGFAMGSRYQAWPAFLVVAAALAWTLRLSGREGRREVLLFAAAALAAVSPWIIRNLALYHNPVYPFLHDYLFPGSAAGWRAMLADGGGRDIVLTLSTWTGFRSYLLYVWTGTFGDNYMGPAMLLVFPVLLLSRYRKPQLAFLWSVFLLMWFSGTLFSNSARFLLPCVPPACVLFAASLEDRFPGWFRTPFYLGLLFMLCSNFMYLAYIFKGYGADRVVLGQETAAEYLRSPHNLYPRPPYPAIEFINNTLPADARVLFLAEARGYYCRRDYMAATLFDEPPLKQWLSTSRDAAGLLERFRAEGITHVLLNRSEMESWQTMQPGYMKLNDREKNIFLDFNRRNLRLIFNGTDPSAGRASMAWSQVFEVVP